MLHVHVVLGSNPHPCQGHGIFFHFLVFFVNFCVIFVRFDHDLEAGALWLLLVLCSMQARRKAARMFNKLAICKVLFCAHGMFKAQFPFAEGQPFRKFGLVAAPEFVATLCSLPSTCAYVQ